MCLSRKGAQYSHLATHSGFDEGGCCGDVTLQFTYSLAAALSRTDREGLLARHEQHCSAVERGGVLPSMPPPGGVDRGGRRSASPPRGGSQSTEALPFAL